MDTRIDVNAKVLAGKPVIRGTRIPVSLILNLVMNGYTIHKICRVYPELTQDDVRAALRYGQRRVDREVVSSIASDLQARIAFS